MGKVRKKTACLPASPAMLRTSLIALLLGSRQGIKDVVIAMIPQIVKVIVGFGTSVLIARGLGPTKLGEYALILSVSSAVIVLSDLGIGQTAIRFASRAISLGDEKQQFAILRWAFRLRMVLVTISTLVFFALAPILAAKVWHVKDLTPLLRLGLLTAVFTALSSVPVVYYQSMKRFGMNAAVLVGQSLISCIGILILAWLKLWSVALVTSVTLIAAGIGALVFLILIPRSAIVPPGGFKIASLSAIHGFWKSPESSSTISNTLDNSSPNKFAVYNLLATVVVMLTLQADVWLMGIYMHDKSRIGMYNVATRFTLPLTIVLGAMNTAIWPRASALTNGKDTIALLSKTFKVSLCVAAVGLCYAIAAPMMAPYFFGSDYTASVLLGQVLCLRYCISILMCPVGVVGYSLGMVRIYWIVNTLQLAVVLALNILLLPVLGPLGSAIALVANDVVGFIATGTIILRKANRIKNAAQLEQPIEKAGCGKIDT